MSMDNELVQYKIIKIIKCFDNTVGYQISVDMDCEHSDMFQIIFFTKPNTWTIKTNY